VGRYGRLSSVHTRIQFATPQGAGYRLRPELGGGIFFDAASYWLQAVQAVCGLGDATGYGQPDFADPSGVDMAFHAGLDWPNGLQSVFDCSFGTGHVAEHEFHFDEAIARLRHFLLPMAGPAPLNLVVLGSVGRTVHSFAPVAYYDHQFGRIRELLIKEAADRECESAAAERIRFMASVYADAGRQFVAESR
jgi:predicted dehydrogenase